MKESIYTLLILAWVVYSIVKFVSNKKSSQQTKEGIKSESDGSLSPGHPTSINSILNAVLGGENINKGEMEHPYSDETKENHLEKEPDYEIYPQENVSEFFSDSDHIDPVYTVDELADIPANTPNKTFGNQNEEVENYQGRQLFNLRQAIINQVILERPY